MEEEVKNPSDNNEKKEINVAEENIKAEDSVAAGADNGVDSDKATAQPKRKKALIITIACIVAVLVACLAVFLILNEKNKQAHTPVAVSFSFEAADYDSQAGSGIPLHVEGVDLDNKDVSETLLVDAGSPGLELLRGSYDITVIGSPVTGSGGIYAVPDTVIHIEIGEDSITINGEVSSFNQNEGVPIELPVVVFTAIKPQDVTDEQIVAIKEWMGEVDFSEETIDKFADLIIADRKAGIAKAEEEKLAAWRTKISGTFSGSGEGSAPPAERAMLYLDGNKLTVRGKLYNQNGSEWHFILTENTKYGWQDEFYHSESREKFIGCFPDQFVAITIEVKDGYIISMWTHA